MKVAAPVAPAWVEPMLAPAVPSMKTATAHLEGKDNDEALFVTDSVDRWADPQSLSHNGLLVKRPFDGKWDAFGPAIDAAKPRFGVESALTTKVLNGGSPRLLSDRIRVSVGELLTVAGLPPPLSGQIVSDACLMGLALGSMCSTARQLDVKLEIFGENTCSRWHQDHFGARAIVTYTGHSGTEYTRDANVDFWELVNCGNNNCVIRNADEVEAVDVGDILLIKGTQFATQFGGATGLVHKSPEKRYLSKRVINRLLLKVDVGTFGKQAEASARAIAQARAAEAMAMRHVAGSR